MYLFTQEDPIGIAGGLNVYAYAGGDPVNYSDPFGLCPVCYVAFEAAFTLYDVGDLAVAGVQYLRGQASGTEFGVTAAGVAVGLVGIGGGYGRAARVSAKVPLPVVKSSPFGSKIASAIESGVPGNWSREQMADAIVDFQTSLVTRRRELRAFDAVGGGSARQRLAHSRRISEEEAFLRSLEKGLEQQMVIEDEVRRIMRGAGDAGRLLNELADQFRRGREINEIAVLLDSQDHELVSIGAWILGELSLELYDKSQIMRRLRELSEHEEAAVRFHAFGALYPALTGEDASTQMLVKRLLDDPNEGVRSIAEAAASKLGLLRC